ncbi:hypothetical protein ACR3K2_01950 [Cryptosporidium serpentis]
MPNMLITREEKGYPILQRGRILEKNLDESYRSKSPSGDLGKSVEELCTCGKHHCPQPIPERQPFCADSSYNQDYRKWELPQHRKAPKSEVLEYLPFEADSSYHQDYRRWELPTRFTKPIDKYIETPETRDFVTSYQSNYKKWDLPQKVGRAPASLSRSTLSCADIPNDTLRQLSLNTHNISTSENYIVAKEDREFNTIYTESFKGKQLEVCPVSLLPPIPHPPPGRHTMFWDSEAKTWY